MRSKSILATAISFTTIILWANIVASEPMSFRSAGNGGNCNGCAWVAAQGEITPDTPANFQEYITKFGKPYIVRLHSPGGNLLAGIRLGELIREQGAETIVGKTVQMTEAGLENYEMGEPGICASACTFAFMGGVERSVGPGSQLGVHQFYSPGVADLSAQDAQELAGVTLLHTINMGIDPRVIIAASETAPDQMFWFDQAALIEFSLDTYVDWTEPWKIEPYSDGLVLTTIHHVGKLRSVAVTLFCRAKDNAWRVLISEENPGFEHHLKGEKLFRFSGAYPMDPTILLGNQRFHVDAQNVEFEKFLEDQVLLSLFLPKIVSSSGGKKLSFEPDLARVYGSLLRVSLVLPDRQWLITTERNCI